jgi:hypothetical protein
MIFALRSRRGLGASVAAGREPSGGAAIDIARIPAAGIGGLGMLAVAAVVAFALPGIQQLMTWSLCGAAAGAAAVLVWRRARGASPFDAALSETLHLR